MKVRLEIFEGPLDLLLYLIKKDHINIHDIPIAGVLEQYLEYLELMKLFDINLASEYLVMAATLIQIKSRTLIPRVDEESEEEEQADPLEHLRYAPVAKMVRYADDIVILTKDKARTLAVSLGRMLKEIGLSLNTAKTKLVKVEEECFDFLGYSFKKAYSLRTQKKSAIFWPSHQAEKSIKRKIKVTTNFRRPIKVEQVIKELNPKLKGWVDYHRVANASKKFLEIRHYAEQRIRKFIRRRGKKRGFGYRDITQDYLYNQLGLFNDYHVKWMKAF